MINRATKLRWRRHFRHRKRQVEDLGSQAEEHLERHFFRRLNRLPGVRRFVLGWILLSVLLVGGLIVQTRALSTYYQTSQPIAGGTFSEGLLGTFTNANPIYAQGNADTSVSRLVFASLLKYDQSNKLVGDLAASWKADNRGMIYTVVLRDGLQWHDGKPLTAEDVVFTFKTIQNPDAKSPLFASWQNIQVELVNKNTVRFTLSNPLASFPTSLTTGIVPKHVLSMVPITELRSSRFNTSQPIGAGPFRWETIEINGNSPETREERIGLFPFELYHSGKPKLQHFIVRAYHDESRLLASFKKHELTAVSGLDNVPDDIQKNDDIHEYSIPLTSETMVFFRTSQDTLKDQKVRQALVQAVNQTDIITGLGYSVIGAKSPLLPGQPGYDRTVAQLSYNQAAANQLLDQAGWVRGKDGIRVKNGKPLAFKLYSQSTSEYASVAPKLQAQWRAVGVDVQVNLQSDTDLQTTISQHNYDALLYGVSLGTDPDVFAFWHSSQADPRLATRLNLSEYKSPVADKALEAGRTRVDPTLRTIKYKPFLTSWRTDAPAIALYQPRFLYISRGKIFNFNPKTINVAADRYNNVENWMIREAKATNK